MSDRQKYVADRKPLKKSISLQTQKVMIIPQRSSRAGDGGERASAINCRMCQGKNKGEL
jgi:hypothetical protein